MALGIIPGEQLKVTNIAPMGCPLQIQLANTLVSVRKKDAQFIQVELLK